MFKFSTLHIIDLFFKELEKNLKLLFCFYFHFRKKKIKLNFFLIWRIRKKNYFSKLVNPAKNEQIYSAHTKLKRKREMKLKRAILTCTKIRTVLFIFLFFNFFYSRMSNINKGLGPNGQFTMLFFVCLFLFCFFLRNWSTIYTMFKWKNPKDKTDIYIFLYVYMCAH